MRALSHIAAACALVGALIALAAAPCRADSEAAAAVEPAAQEPPAAEVAQAPELLLFQDIPVVVTASRMEERVTDAPASVTVITREQILNSGAISIPDILRMAPGVEVMQTTGGSWEVGIRGFDQPVANKVLVLVDGRTVYNDFYANVNWYGLPVVLEDIERIEIIRGPLSSLWGANATVGVINIITRSPAEAQGATATADYGTRGALRANAIYGWKSANERSHYKVIIAHEQEGQWPASSEAVRQGEVADRDSGTVTKVSAAADWGARWRLSMGRNDGAVALISPYSMGQMLWDESTGFASLSYQGDNLSMRAYWNGARFQVTRFGFAPCVIYTDLYDLEALKSDVIGRHRALWGASYRATQLGQAGGLLFDGPHHQRLPAAYLQDDYQASERTRLVLNARWDDHPLAGARLSGRATVMHSFTPEHTLRFSAATAFRSPNFVESYFAMFVELPSLPPTGMWGNTDLNCEGITAYDLEYRTRLSPRTTGSICLYYSRLDNVILASPILVFPPQSRFENVGQARSAGVEMEVRHALSPALSAFANYTYQSLSGDQAVRDDLVDLTPRHKANLGFNLSDPERGLTGSLLAAYRDQVAGGAGPYVLVNGYLGKRFGDVEWGVSFFNLANVQHQEYGQGDIIGRRIMGSVRREF
ncbi:MAG TPA: TonB-dependent receptor [Armatimonadota bacterium]|nr:TonB-dependent receptor [Armatimonadota bacterium]